MKNEGYDTRHALEDKKMKDLMSCIGETGSTRHARRGEQQAGMLQILMPALLLSLLLVTRNAGGGGVFVVSHLLANLPPATCRLIR